MALPLPVLDDLAYQSLVDGMRERLPRTAPEWTDHNASDPGITLLELFSYLGDAMLYRLDRITPRQQRAFLRLLDCEPRPAQAAHAVVELSLKNAAQPRRLEAQSRIADASGTALFQTRSPIYVSKAALVTALVSTRGHWEDYSKANSGLSDPFHPFGADPEPGDALYLGFDRRPGPDGKRLRLFVAGENVPRDMNTWSSLAAEARQANIEHLENQCGVRRDRCGECAMPKFWKHYGVRVVWEFFDGQAWQPLPFVRDYTRALSLSGPVCWRAPAAHARGGVAGHQNRYFVRCRIAAGVYDCPPSIRGIRFNAVLARHAVSVRGVVEPRRSTGAAAQRFSVDQRPIVPDSLRVTFAKRRAVATHWRERPDFDRSGPHARHFVVDHNAGAVLFGDGRAGDVPPAGGVITARWRVGGGPSGNLPVDTLTGVKDAGDLELQQSLPAWGGADAESLDAAKARAFARLRDERCAATLADLERVAKSAPGLPVAAAYAVTEHHPDIQCVPAAGCVTVVIVPLCVNYRREATAALCRALGRHVDARRPLGLEVHVTAARFSKVSVTAALALERRVDRGRVFAAAASALEQFLHPLRGGRDNNGWKAGRAVYRSEVLAQLQAVVGIRYVASLTLTADDASPTQCGDVVICPNGLVASGTHSFTAL